MEKTRGQFGTVGVDQPKQGQPKHPHQPQSLRLDHKRKKESVQKGTDDPHYPIQSSREQRLPVVRAHGHRDAQAQDDTRREQVVTCQRHSERRRMLLLVVAIYVTTWALSG